MNKIKVMALIIGLFFSTFTWAALDRINIDMSEGCPGVVRDEEPRPGNRCKGDNACRKPGENVRWVVTGGSSSAFSVTFRGSPPFDDYPRGQCKEKSGAANMIQCKISNSAPVGSEYEYDVTVGSCEIDPRIVIH